LARFQHLHPTTDLEFQTSSSEKLERMVAKATMQLAVTDRKPPSRDLARERLRREKVLAFVPPNHPLALRKTVKLSEVLAEPLIIRGGKGISGTTENALKKLRDQGWVVRVGMRCDGPGAIKAAVRQGMGVGIAFADSIKVEIDSDEFTALKVDGLDLKAESFIIFAKNRPLSPAAREFLDLLRETRTSQMTDSRSRSSNRSTTSLRSLRGSVRSKSSSRSIASLRSNRTKLLPVSASPEVTGGSKITLPLPDTGIT
jgi:DNA-binding transcriptional LysR family regulator